MAFAISSNSNYIGIHKRYSTKIKSIKLLAALATAVALVSCEKVVNIDLKNAESKIVIEGIIDNSGNAAKVNITKSISFFYLINITVPFFV